jgi:predicted nucleic acid-binding protein
MSPAYYDANYLLKLQINEGGSTEVRAHAATVLEIHTAQHARAEFASAAFRKVREGVATTADYDRLMAQLRSDIASTTIVLLPLTDAILDRARALHGLKRFVEARKSADEALALRPQGRTSAYLRVVSGDLYVEENNLSQAAADYLYVINFHEDADLKPLAIHKYIGVLEKQGKADEAAKFKAKLTTEFPNWKTP